MKKIWIKLIKYNIILAAVLVFQTRLSNAGVYDLSEKPKSYSSIEEKGKALNAEILFSKIHNETIRAISSIYEKRGMTEDQARFKTAFILSRMDLGKMREKVLNCLKENNIGAGKISNSKELREKCDRDYVDTVAQTANINVESDKDIKEGALAYRLEDLVSEKFYELRQKGYSKQDTHAIIGSAHGRLNTNKCVKDALERLDKQEKKDMRTCLSPCFQEFEEIVEDVIKDYELKPEA